MSGWLVGW
ncbi:hypothetical protein M0802_015448 [Mischocyttarus mexicanus]|nr:hypothetical protein M0802_015448 [Mischocyttarus mexicanus]